MALKGKSVIVTGGASGMGRASALLIASHGAKVVIADIQADKGAEVVKEIQAAGGTAFFQKTDLTSRKEVQALVAETVKRYGRIDILANVAGNAFHKSFLEIDDELWDRTVKINLYGTFYVNQETARVMVKQGGGRIINFASTVAATGGADLPAYSAAKAGVVTLSKGMQNELAKHNIMIFVVAPGATDTPLWRRGRTEEDLARMQRRLKFGRAVKAEEIAELVAFLADDTTAHMLAGQTFHTCGASFMGF
ncbi:MAG: SDR family oxidoreductase [Chloroflexi bacterium]|nr:SDR family oxidoreductase [Chloroflexota bacterium]